MTPERWQQIKAVLAAALEQTPAERAAFLDQACDGDGVLRAEVESLIAYQQPGDSAGLSSATCSNGEARPFDSLAEEMGRRIGPYQIIRELGRGGMGAVYLAARADEEYRQMVAIKLVRPGLDTDFILRRFRNERQILAALDHPNIARLLDGGTTEDGLPYLVMEYVAGIPIAEYCDQHALDIKERLKLFQQVCAAVHYAHQRQVIHRDIKPSNILVTAEGGLKLLDFGIAKLLTPELAAQTLDPTLTALRLMTPAYASPEQIKGEPITAATDVYSLGVLLYELLTGHKPYRVKSQAAHEIAQAVIEEEPIKPSTAIILTEQTQTSDGSSAMTLTPELVSKLREGSPDRLRRRLRGDLDNIILTALRKDPQRRYASVEQFSDDIRRHLEGLPIIARKDTLAYRTTKFMRRNKVGVAAVMLSVALLGLAALLTYLGLPSNTQPIVARPRSVAVLPFKVVSAEAGDDYLGPGIADAIISGLTNLRGITVRPIRASLKYTSANQDPAEPGRALQVDAIIEGSVIREGSNFKIIAQLVRVEDGARLWEMKPGDQFDQLLTVRNIVPFEVAEALELELTDQEKMLLTKRQTESIEAYHLYLKGRHFFNRRTPQDVKPAIECFEQAIQLDPHHALAYAGLAHAHLLGVNPLPTIVKIEKARAAAMKALENDDTLAEAHTVFGRATLLRDWDWAGSEKAYQRAIELSPRYPDAHFWYADNLSAQGRHEEAIAEMKLVIEIEPGSSRNHFNLAGVFYLARQDDRAIEHLRQTPLGLDSVYYRVYSNLGQVYLQKAMYGEAIEMLQKASTLSEGRTIARAMLGYAYAKSGNRAEAQKILDELSDLYEQPNAPVITMAAIYGCLGDNDRAFAWLEKAHREREGRLIILKVDPMLDSLHADPRFADLLRRIGLAP
jgi:serine/threonine protein kinase/tetratricopeptide (TPR) repeat protein